MNNEIIDKIIEYYNFENLSCNPEEENNTTMIMLQNEHLRIELVII
jgi:hypothetical protein